jgi:hypothetical protein
LLDIELFLCQQFEKDEHPNQDGNIPVERNLLEGVDHAVQGVVQLVHQVAVDKGSVANHSASFALKCLRLPSIFILTSVLCKVLHSPLLIFSHEALKDNQAG